jgi:hypothetical protein
MFTETTGIVKLILSILLFPLYFQYDFLYFAWGLDDTTWMMLGKRLFLLLPVLALILACWLTILCAITIIVRPNRRQFIISLLMTWWDLGKSIVSFWGGVFKFAFTFALAVFSLLKVILLGVWSLIQEIIFMPFRFVKNVGQNVVTSEIPWIAVYLTIFWCLVEATIFTYVTTPLVMDTFANLTGEALSINVIRIPLYVFLLFVVLGSYAVLSTMIEVIKKKNISGILGILVIEFIVMMVEVMFLYREFVDSLVPWLAQYSEGFELGIFWTIAISVFVWFGIRSLSWFLFASHGTPTIMSVIRGEGLKTEKKRAVSKVRLTDISFDFMDRIKKDSQWIEQKGEEVLGAFMLPPLQVVAAALNFLTLLFVGKHLFDLPFKSLDDIKESSTIISAHSFREEVPKNV